MRSLSPLADAAARDLVPLAPAIDTIVDLLRLRATANAAEVAYTFLDAGESPSETLTWGDLDIRSRALAAAIAARVPAGGRAILLYPSGLDFIVAFFACLYAGVVAVPVAVPRSRRDRPSALRFAAIVGDASARVVLSTGRAIDRWREDGTIVPGAARWLATDVIDPLDAERWSRPDGLRPESLALLQYTSGSTAEPRGVMVTHGNLLHNLADAQALGGGDARGPSVSWLPMTHDMGLVEGVLQPLWAGTPATLMSPAAFLQRPARWLEAIARTGAVRSGGPNFAYDLCVRRVGAAERARLDLSRWRAAYSGAEPIRGSTLAAFAEAFAASGFDGTAFRPCYGLAEATLVVASGRWTGGAGRHATAPDAPISCGTTAPGTTVRIVDPETRLEQPEGGVGEIWVRGPGVARGYWNRLTDTRRVFHAEIAGRPERHLRTGDLGTLKDGQLVVSGRIKDVLIVRGQKLFPQDLEATAEAAHTAIRPASAATFRIDRDVQGDRIAVAVELHPRGQAAGAGSYDEVVDAIRLAVAEGHGVQLAAVLLLQPGGVPRTTSGKIRRHACAALLEGADAAPLHVWRA